MLQQRFEHAQVLGLVDAVVPKGQSLIVNGPFKFLGGDAVNIVRLQAKAIALNGPTTIVNGDGFDAIAFGDFNPGSTFTSKGIAISSGDGFSQIDFKAETSSVNGSLAVKSNNGYRFTVIDVVKTFAVTRATTFAGSSGGSEIYFNQTESATIGGLLQVTNGSGVDIHDFGSGGGTTAFHGIAIANGGGDSFTQFFGGAVTNSGALRIASGAGRSNLRVLNDSFANAGPVTISSGEGPSWVFFNSATATTIGGKLTVTGLSGDDTFSFAQAGAIVTTKAMAFNLGDGLNAVSLNGILTANGAVTYKGTDGGNALGIGDTAGSTATINGAIGFYTGTGEDTFILGAPTASGAITVTGAVTVATGAGHDVVGFARATVGGAVAVNTGSANDSISIDNSTFNRAATFATGLGDDNFTIEMGLNNDGIGTKFLGGINVKMGAGEDELFLDFDDDDKIVLTPGSGFNGGPGELDHFAYGFNATILENGDKMLLEQAIMQWEYISIFD